MPDIISPPLPTCQLWAPLDDHWWPFAGSDWREDRGIKGAGE